MYWSPRKSWLSYFIFYIDDILHKYTYHKNIYIYNTTFWIWKSLQLDIFEKKKKKKRQVDLQRKYLQSNSILEFIHTHDIQIYTKFRRKAVP